MAAASYDRRPLKTPNPVTGECCVYRVRCSRGSGKARVWDKYTVDTEDQARELVAVFKSRGYIPEELLPLEYRAKPTPVPATDGTSITLREFGRQVYDALPEDPESAVLSRRWSVFERIWCPSLGGRRVIDVTVDDIQKAQDALRKSDGTLYGSSSVSDYKTSLRIIFEAATRPFNGQPALRHDNPLIGVRPPKKNVKPPKATVRYENAARFLEICAEVDPRLVEPVEAGFQMGWRWSEMAGLDVGYVFLGASPHVTIRQTWGPNKKRKADRGLTEGSHVLKPFGKTHAAYRDIPIPRSAVPLFERLVEGKAKADPVFEFRRARIGGTPRNSAQARERWLYSAFWDPSESRRRSLRRRQGATR